MQDELRKGYELVEFTQGETSCPFRFEPRTQEIWATSKTIADLFEVGANTIIRHISNIYDDGELEENRTSTKIVLVQTRCKTAHAGGLLSLQCGFIPVALNHASRLAWTGRPW